MTVALERDRARRYARTTDDYGSSWVAAIKKQVNNAGSEDWGTYIAACALLESAVPQVVQDMVQIEIEEEGRRARSEAAATRTCRYRQIACSVLGSLSAVAWLLLVGVPSSIVFSPAGAVLFSVTGGAGAGFALGSLAGRRSSPRGELDSPRFGQACLFACLAGIACALACPALPPVALVLLWTAWHTGFSAKPFAQINPTETFLEYRRLHGTRELAHDSHAPSFVKRGVRLAGIHRYDEGPEGDLAREALGRDQSDYGAFAVYDGALWVHHQQRTTQKEQKRASRDAADKVVDTKGDSSDDETRTVRSPFGARGARMGMTVGLLLFLCAEPSITSWLLFAVVLPVCAIAGFESGRRVANMIPHEEADDGSDDDGGSGGRHTRCADIASIASIARPAWFAAWAALLVICLFALL